jgi:perosamine synthetase
MEASKVDKFYPLMIPYITESDIESVINVLRSGMLIQGKNVNLLEKRIKEITRTENAVALSNGTATLHLALLALGIGKGDEVIVPAFSYVATANVVEIVGATPIFVDIEIETFNIDVNKIKSAITKKTKAIIPVHEFGLACNIGEIVEIANNNNLHVIEDAACALGAKENAQPVGSFGVLGSFSFHPRKSVTSGEGGILTTNDQKIAKRLKTLCNHGIDAESTEMDFIEAGYNYRLTDIQASLLNSQLNRLDEIINKKHLLASVYLNELSATNLKLPIIPFNKNHTWQTFHIILPDKKDRKKIISNLKSVGISTNYGAQCIPETTFYKNKYGYNSIDKFPNAFKAYNQGLAIPLYYSLEKEDIYSIAKQINKIIL